MFNFEKLDVWQKSIALADLTYRLTRNFPAEERFGLTNQMRRAAASVSANIAEGSARPPADFSKFLGYATGSLYEVVTHANVARHQGFFATAGYHEIYREAEEIARMLSGLRKSLGE